MKTPALIILVFLSNSLACVTGQQTIPSAKPGAGSSYTYRKASPDGIGKFYLGREISQVMGADGSGWLERNNRQQEENTNRAIENIHVQPNSVIADIGAGTGYYTFKLTPKVPQGKIYAVEIQEELINILNSKKALIKDSIVEIIKGSALSPNLPENSIDLAIMVDVYHELEYPKEMLQSIRKSLKRNGKILLIEYRGEDADVPIKKLHKTTVAQLNRELAENGFKLFFKGDFLPIQHFLLYQKKE